MVSKQHENPLLFGLPVLLDPVRKLGRLLESYKTTKEYVNIAVSATRQEKLKQSSGTATGQGKNDLGIVTSLS